MCPAELLNTWLSFAQWKPRSIQTVVCLKTPTPFPFSQENLKHSPKAPRYAAWAGLCGCFLTSDGHTRGARAWCERGSSMIWFAILLVRAVGNSCCSVRDLTAVLTGCPRCGGFQSLRLIIPRRKGQNAPD